MANSDKRASVPDSARIIELWTTIKTLLAQKVDVSALKDYPTIDAVASAISTALLDYATDSDVQSKIASALVDYMTRSEINEAIVNAIKNTSKLRKEVVDVLPEVGEDDVIYLVPSDNPSERDIKLEYLYINGEYEQIGSTMTDMDQYWSKEELSIMTPEELEEILK